MVKKQQHVSETPGHPAPAPARRGVHRARLRVRRARRHGGVRAPARRARARGGEDARDAGRPGRAAHRADARRQAGEHEEPGPGDRRESRGAVQARGGAAPQRLPGGRHVAVRHPQGDAGLRGSRRAGAAARAAQRRAAGLPGGHRPGHPCLAGSARSRCSARCRQWRATRRHDDHRADEHPGRRPGRPRRRRPRGARAARRRAARPPAGPHRRRRGGPHRAGPRGLPGLAHRAAAGARRARPPLRRGAARVQGAARPAGVAGGRQDRQRGPGRGAGDDRHLRLRGRPVAPALRPDDRVGAPRAPHDGDVAPGGRRAA